MTRLSQSINLWLIFSYKTSGTPSQNAKAQKNDVTSSLVDLSCLGGVAGDAWDNRSGSTLLVRLLSEARFYNGEECSKLIRTFRARVFLYSNCGFFSGDDDDDVGVYSV